MRASELGHVQDPWRSRLRWLGVFIVLLVCIVFASFVALDRVRTYSLPTGGVQLSMQYSQYLVGEPVSFTIKNGFNSPISIATSCPSEPVAVYRMAGKQWLRIHDTATATLCSEPSGTMQIPAAGISTVSLANWPHLFATPGTYRIALQVEYSNTLPYVDFSVINPPLPYVAPAPTEDATLQNNSVPSSSRSANTSLPSSSSRTPQTITLYVNSAGNYSLSDISIHSGDTLRIVYQPAGENEVITSFTPTGGTSASIRPITVDQENRTVSRVMSAAGSWTFQATDHNGNSGNLVVSP